MAEDMAADRSSAGSAFDIDRALDDFLGGIGLDRADTGGSVTFAGEDPILPSRHRLGGCIAVPIMAGAVGVASIWRARTGRGQDLHLDLRKAIHGINPLLKFTPLTVRGSCRSEWRS